MNTPSHLILNLAVGTRVARSSAERWAVAVGALLPDAPMFVFYAWNRGVLGMPEAVIWEQLYFESAGWRALFDGFNSFPILAAVLALCWWREHRVGALVAGSAILHCLCDLPIHHDDGHRHFFPLSDWIYASPVSYWDPAHHGAWISAIELAVVAAAARFLWPTLASRVARGCLLLVVTVYAAGWLGFYGRGLL